MAKVHQTEDCFGRLNELTRQDLEGLAGFAGRRLAHFRLALVFQDDLTGKALQAVVVGAGDPRTGRQPRPRDLASKAAFLQFLRGVVASTVEGYARRGEHRFRHLELEAAIPEAVESGESPALWRDFQTQFFQRLRQQSSPVLGATLNEWERECSRTDHVPRISSPHHARAVRLLARNILRQLEPKGWLV